jgi:protein SCO1/2
VGQGLPFGGKERALNDDPSFQANFELTDHRGVVRTDEDFSGRWMLVFFGFTNCPDVCPTGLATIARVMDDLGSNAEQIQPLLISVDPERDNPAVLAEYVPQFHPSIIGLTGSPDQIKRTARTFNIYYERIEEAAIPGGYTMGHSSSILLFGPEGAFIRSYGYSSANAWMDRAT